MMNAEVIIKNINLITTKAIVSSGIEPSIKPTDACQFFEIGPVAALPKK